jgi:ABC-2 type transport system permease protein
MTGSIVSLARSLARLVRIELLKLRTTPALWVTLAGTALLTIVSVFTTVLLAGQPGTEPLGSVPNVSKVLAVGVVSSIVMLVLGIMISAAEDRHRTSLSTYLAEPRRGRVLVAKMVTAGGLGTVGGAGTFALALAVAIPLYAAKGVHQLPVNVGALWLGTTLMTACYGLLGVALGALTRNTVAAIIGALAWVGVVELGLLQPLIPAFAKWLPTGAGRALTSVGPGQPDHLAPAVAALVLVGWAVTVATTASTITLRREPR